jgi:hypothetical protein
MVTEPPFEIDGQVFETVADLSRYSGIHYATLRYRLLKDMSVEEAIKHSHQQRQREKTTSKTYEFNGKTYKSIKSHSDETGVPYATLRWRLQEDWDVETAVLPPYTLSVFLEDAVHRCRTLKRYSLLVVLRGSRGVKSKQNLDGISSYSGCEGSREGQGLQRLPSTPYP